MDRIFIGAGFLDSCPELTRFVYEYWLGKAGERRLAYREDIEPADLIPALPGIQLIDVLRDTPHEGGIKRGYRFVYRLLGTKEVNVRHGNPVGLPVEEGFFGNDVARVLNNYTQVAETGNVVCDFEEVTVPAGYRVQDVSLFLPLTLDGKSVQQILVYSEQSFLR